MLPPRTLTDLCFLVALFAPIGTALCLTTSFLLGHQPPSRPIKLWSVAFLLSLLMNPVVQLFLLEPLDNLRGDTFRRRASEAGIIGMDQEQVRALFDEPDKRGECKDVTTWEYKQLPGYWFGSNFQIFFRSGRVYGTEPNDD